MRRATPSDMLESRMPKEGAYCLWMCHASHCLIQSSSTRSSSSKHCILSGLKQGSRGVPHLRQQQHCHQKSLASPWLMADCRPLHCGLSGWVPVHGNSIQTCVLWDAVGHRVSMVRSEHPRQMYRSPCIANRYNLQVCLIVKPADGIGRYIVQACSGFRTKCLTMPTALGMNIESQLGRARQAACKY